MVEMGNLYYFIYLGIFLLLTVSIGFLLKGKSQNKQYKILLILAFINLAIHFMKLLLPKYSNDLPISFRKVTFENICAVSTLIYPFILLWKNKYAKDYMFYMGVLSGLASMIYPAEALGREAFDLDVVRFYICHMLIFIIPFYMGFYGIHTLDIKRVFFVPISFFIVLGIILINEIILMEAGFVDMRGDDFMNYNYRNSNFIFGPTYNLEKLSDVLLDWMVPKPFKTVMVGPHAGESKYMPILWLVVPCFVYIPILCSIIYFIVVKVLRRNISAYMNI